MSGTSDAQVDIKRLISDAVEDACDGPLDTPRLESIRQLLLTSSDARRYYLQVNELNHQLAAGGSLPVVSDAGAAQTTARDTRQYQPVPRSRFFSRQIVLCALACAATAAVVAVLAYNRQQPPAPPRTVASLEQINGEVLITGADAETRTIAADTKIASGDTIRTQGALSSAVLLYPDKSRLSLVGDSSLTVSDDGRKSVVFHGGTMFASVAPQPTGRPMLVATPQDKLQVLGTRFSLDASIHRTDLSVREGRVKITRLRDGKSVEVPAGQRVVSDSATELTLEQIPAAPDSWGVDFENGLPDDWVSGELIADGLPSDSRFAVKAVMVDDGDEKSYAIVSQPEWLRGTFSVHPDSHMQITCKMTNPNWINLFLITRTEESGVPRFANNFQYNEIPFHRLQPNRWYSMTVPLSEFKRLPGYTDEPLRDLLPFQIVFSAPAPDRGLVVDRITISRGGPGTVKMDVLEETNDSE